MAFLSHAFFPSRPESGLATAAAASADDPPEEGAPTKAARRIEADLVARARARDERALAVLYQRHAPAILRFLGDLLRDRAAAADATQETFARAFRRIDTLHDDDRLAPWLFGIARNVSLEQRKARRRSARVLVQGAIAEPPPEGRSDDGATPEGDLLAREAAGVVDRALAKMNDDRRAAVLLRIEHGLSYEDIALAMGWTLAKAKIEVFRARGALRAELVTYEGGEP